MSKWPGKHHTFSDPSTAVLYMEICFSKLKFYSFYAITRRLTVSTWDEPIKKQLWRGQEVTTFLGKGITVLRLWSLWIGTQLVIYITPSVFVSYQHHCLNFPQIGWMLMLCKDWWFKFKQNTRLRAAFGTLFSVQRYQKTCYNKQVVSASLVGYKIFNTRRGFTIHDSSEGNIRHEFTMATIDSAHPHATSSPRRDANDATKFCSCYMCCGSTIRYHSLLMATMFEPLVFDVNSWKWGFRLCYEWRSGRYAL